ncbi:WYL domain-containing protein [Paenibacillus sp. TRM 82003]|uniref:helix-turn-helix transcriptional regulator n=1 Tax=Kineococcus sp. TRM81007 TaxID=2925831 RepID=UPI001F569F05|nr:WYL domain-containing protein [Kineococcus sp. TRM81007]MCI2237720.1 WYL domain-containing protein [Kineococcus sp. TRM81007]MCI3921738.1 WYL domain-containing protein [Paenibacillus sp. TRM 82003]
MSGSASTERLSRLLAMVPYLLRHQGLPLEEAAEHFGITTDDLVHDLELLFVCGTPGHLPDDLIDARWDSGRVYLSNADPIARPARLAVDEAVALLVGLRTLAEVPGLHDRDALAGATAKLTEAAGEAAGRAAEAAGAVRVDVRTGDDAALADVLATCRRGLAGHRRLHLAYLVPSRDERTERDVDPMRLVTVAGRWYLEAWCHRVEGVRLFRLDRIEAARVLDADGTPPAGAVSRDVHSDLFRPSPDDLVVTLDLAPQAAWVVDYYPVESVQPAPEDAWERASLRVRLRAADTRWVRRLLLRLGAGARAVDPPELAVEVREAALAALARYELLDAGSAGGPAGEPGPGPGA